MTLTQDILAHAQALGFDIAGIIPFAAPRHGAAFTDWLTAGYHGEMAYLAARAAERADPVRLAPDARSVVLVAANYSPGSPSIGSDDPAWGRVARYAWGPDYHDVIKPKLYAIDVFVRARTGRVALGKTFVDTAPVLERDFAEQAGLGFIGRNCCLITPGLGSWTFLAGLLVPEELEAGSWKLETGNWKLEAKNPSENRTEHPELVEGCDPPPSPAILRHGLPASQDARLGLRIGAKDSRRTWQGCGRCTRCLDACPTRAFVGPHVLDARRCISYLTIELRGLIPRDLRASMGNWVFGCDVCQEICPYNRAAPASRHIPRVDSDLSLVELLALDNVGFRARFRGTSVLRAKRRGLVRNACVAAGNAREPALVPVLTALLADSELLVRGHAAWALGQIGGAEAVRALARAYAVETEPWVREEIALARKPQA